MMDRRHPVFVRLGKDGAFYSRSRRYSGESARIIALVLRYSR